VISLTTKGRAAQWIRYDDVPIIALHKPMRNDLGVIFRLASTLRHYHVDIVHSHNWGTLIETSLARRLARVPIHVHAERGTVLGDLELRGFKRFMRSWAMAWALRHVNVVVSNARAIAARVEGLCGYPAHKIVLIPNGIEAPRVDDRSRARQEVRRQLDIHEDAIVIGSVGRLVPVKAFHLAIEALACMPTEVTTHTPVHLLLVGDGPEHERLHQCARTRSLEDRVHLVGLQTEIGRWLAAMDIYINTSISEGMSQSLVEAMAFSLPLVVTDVGDSGIVVRGEPPCGRVVPPGNAEALCRALTALITDQNACTELGRNARKSYEARYTVSAMVRAYETMYGQWAGLVTGSQKIVPLAQDYGTAQR